MADNASPEPTNVNTEHASPSLEVPSAFSLFKPSWEGVKLNIVELIMIWLVPTLALVALLITSMAAAGISGDWFMTGSGSNPGGGMIALLIALVVAVVLIYVVLIGPALVHVQLKSARMEKATYAGAWATSKKFWWRYLLVSLAVGLTIGIGFLLLLVPGIIFLRRYFLSQYALIDQDLSVGGSMRASNELSKGRSGAVFGIIGVDILIALPNIIPVIGGAITFILQIAYFCAPAVRYEQLKALKPVVKPAAKPVAPAAPAA